MHLKVKLCRRSTTEERRPSLFATPAFHYHKLPVKCFWKRAPFFASEGVGKKCYSVIKCCSGCDCRLQIESMQRQPQSSARRGGKQINKTKQKQPSTLSEQVRSGCAPPPAPPSTPWQRRCAAGKPPFANATIPSGAAKRVGGEEEQRRRIPAA